MNGKRYLTAWITDPGPSPDGADGPLETPSYTKAVTWAAPNPYTASEATYSLWAFLFDVPGNELKMMVQFKLNVK